MKDSTCTHHSYSDRAYVEDNCPVCQQFKINQLEQNVAFLQGGLIGIQLLSTDKALNARIQKLLDETDV